MIIIIHTASDSCQGSEHHYGRKKMIEVINELFLNSGSPPAQTADIETLQSQSSSFNLKRTILRNGSVNFSISRATGLTTNFTPVVPDIQATDIASHIRIGRPLIPNLLRKFGLESLACEAEKASPTGISVIDSKKFAGGRMMILGSANSLGEVGPDFELVLRFDDKDDDLSFNLKAKIVAQAIESGTSTLQAALKEHPSAVEKIARLDPKLAVLLEKFEIKNSIAKTSKDIGRKRPKSL